MSEELKNTAPPVEGKPSQKSPEELVAESKERTAIYEGSRVAENGLRQISYFASNEQAWEGVAPPEDRDQTTEHAKHTWSLQTQKKILDSGGDLVIKRGHIRHQALLPDNYGYKVPEMAYEFEGTGFSASYALDSEGNPTRTMVYEVPKDNKKPRRIELFTRKGGSLEVQSGTPEFDVLEQELFVEVGKGLRHAPQELTEQEAIDAMNEQGTDEAVEEHFGPELDDIRNLPETPENPNSH